MGNRVFFDTNIVLDIIDSSRKSHKNALRVWESSVHEGIDIVISEDMLSTIFYINEDKKYALEFFKFIQNEWHIIAFGKKVIEHAISLSLEKGLDLEDTLQCLCAKENGCNIFITNDKKSYDCGIKVISIEEFLEQKK